MELGYGLGGEGVHSLSITASQLTCNFGLKTKCIHYLSFGRSEV